MTCVVAVRCADGSILMGADSAGVGGYSITNRADPKIYRVGEMLIGFTTSYRMGQLLGYSLILPEHHEDVDSDRYMRTVFVDAVRKCLKDGGFAEKDKEQEKGGMFLVAYQKRIFCVESDYQVAERRGSFNAVGCGWEIALGSLFTSEKKTKTAAKQRVLLALEAAAEFSAGVRGPFLIEELAA